jgi:hypothetical protein
LPGWSIESGPRPKRDARTSSSGWPSAWRNSRRSYSRTPRPSPRNRAHRRPLDISEEVVRLRAHLSQWEAMVEGHEACGRKLDFLLQEMNREINTIAAKSNGVSVSELIVEAKAELEKMREQVQNVE